MPSPIEQAVAAMFGDLDLEDVQKVLEERGIPLAYSDEAVARLNDEASELADQAAALKAAEAPREERRAARDEVTRLVQARSFLYRIRPARPSDVAVTPGGNG